MFSFLFYAFSTTEIITHLRPAYSLVKVQKAGTGRTRKDTPSFPGVAASGGIFYNLLEERHRPVLPPQQKPEHLQ